MSKPAARVGDHHKCPIVEGLKPHVGGPILEGSPNVFIGGLPAARVGDRLGCIGATDTISDGEPTVRVNGRPAARQGDETAHGGVIIGGCGNVRIGTGRAARCLEKAAAAGSPVVVIE
jgi:uncharacterized Zn-binding protein involved in type VI secretion